MGIDTVKLRSPVIDETLAQFLENQSVLRQGIELSSGEILYELTAGNLDGSYDSRISFKVMREDHVLDRNGRPELVPCEPYIVTEASLHKVFYGQNIYGNPTGFQSLCARFIDVLGVLFNDDAGLLPSAKGWEVRRVDWAEVYQLTPAAIAEFLRSLHQAKFPRRRSMNFRTAKTGSNGAYYPGSTTTLKFYHKGPEFKEHDWNRVKQALTRYIFEKTKHLYQYADGTKKSNASAQYDKNYRWVEKKLKALQRLANNRLRAEVEIHSDKLAADFTPEFAEKSHFPLVSEITDDYLKKVHDTEVFKLLKEGKTEMETVRTADKVLARLNAMYGKRSANPLNSFWTTLAGRGEEITRSQYSKAQFYANRKKLIDAGISWHQSNVFILEQDTALPRDFVPMRTNSRICSLPVRADSLFNICPTHQMREERKAA